MIDEMKGLKRTAYCGELRADDEGQTFVLAGWAARQRDLGNLIFIDLRDRTGIMQLAFDAESEPAVFEKARLVRGEFVLMASGVLRRRQSINTDLLTGEVELYVKDLRILSVSKTPPFEIGERTNAKEELRLRYRYLDLRRPELQHAMVMRHRIVKLVRDYFDRNRFIEIETPILIKSTPEGARDYLVPSRVHPGKFFALPQSPQLYKQISMLAGFDRYMQIARCFRDEDLRADRQPEFTQIDIEMSFVDEGDVQAMNEGLMKEIFREILGVDLPLPLPRISYREAMERFGSDKPDTRFDLELVNLSDVLKGSNFAVFSNALQSGGSVRAINAKGAASLISRKETDKLTETVKLYRAKGLAYTRLTKEGINSSFEKFLTPEEIAGIYGRTDAKTGDLLFLVADADDAVVFSALGSLRLALAKQLDIIPKNRFDLLWVTDFPLLEYDAEEKRYSPMHHPFTAPNPEDLPQLEQNPGLVRARAYDLVLNGSELGGGSIRISDPEMQRRMFAALGMSEKESNDRFGFLLEAFQYGVPPHGGMAYGLDRLVMLLLNRESIRDVIAFPKVQNASELMSGCPSNVDEKNLQELSIALVTPAE
jgi:aspartyl-tRNA synthetase